MATDLQRDLAEAIVKNAKLPRAKRKNKTELLESIGYAPTTAEKEAKTILEAKGVQEVLDDLGFNENNAMKVVSEIMLDPAKDANARLKATDQVFKVKGTYAPEKSVSLSLNVSPEKQKTATEAIARFLNGNTRNPTEQR